jgi:geranylgeranyl diphosphate synthase type I
MILDKFAKIYLPAIENELKNSINRLKGPLYFELQQMMAYHMGWEGERTRSSAGGGKRIRPLLVLLTTAASGGDWQLALPAAASVELIHNFSLLHDDIEDNSPSRRGRPTVWVRWGVSQAINTGDAMFSLAHLMMLELDKGISPIVTLEAVKIIQNTCLHLTQGQYLDISYEDRNDLRLEDYYPMISGKTAALIAACTEIGALVAGANKDIQEHFRTFGLNLGLAFQALDDLLGIWGDPTKIGKSNASDLLSGKKSLPVLYGLEKGGVFSERWMKGGISPDEVPELARELEIEGGRAYTQEAADQFTQKALEALKNAKPTGEPGKALRILSNQLLQREV